ncbi:MAG TPA: SDR family NAD(P)-dependent oxidoreductase, partial [Microlunatus sp.]|nr:SDR family NAD(P)-dependent oxidoreductase [Microlunatus sp.]
METKTIVITGATDGLGRAVALELAAEGHRLILHGRRPEALAEVRSAVAAAGGADPLTVRADLSSSAEVRDLAEQISACTDQVDVLVNNAGVGPAGPDQGPRPLTVDGQDLCFAVNYLAAFDLTHRLLPSIGGRVVNVASLGQAPIQFDDLALQRRYDDWWLPYNQSKLAMITWGFTLAERVHGITVNSLHPGTFMPTKMVLDAGIAPVHSVRSGVTATVRLITDPALDEVTGRFFDQLEESRAHVADAY